ncbi:hypothetical protein [Nocardiopsis oceani]
MPTAATTPAVPVTARLPHRRRLSIALGAAFVGSTLIAVMAPAHAEPAAVGFAFTSTSDSVEKGSSAENTLTVTNLGDATVCLLGLDVDGPFEAAEFSEQSLESRGEAHSAVTGTPEETTDVVATLRYVLPDPGTECTDVDDADAVSIPSDTWTVEVTDPEPSEPPEEPTETPTDEPTEDPSETPTDEPTEDPSETPTDEPTEDPSETPTDGPTEGPDAPDPGDPSDTPSETPPSDGNDENEDTGSGGGDGSGGGGGGGEAGGGGNTPNVPGNSPSSGVDSVPTSDADIPTLPRNEADLPDLSPGSSEDLAELPMVTPTSEDEDEDTETEVAADHSEIGSSVTPAVLLAAFLLALLLAAPLAPTRRVRLGTGYQGKRRRA